MRSLLPLILLVPSACGEVSKGGKGSAEVDSRIDCQVAGAAAFEPVCTVEQFQASRGRTLTIRKPDGGFRRLLVTTDGRGVVAADGAEKALVTRTDDGLIEVSIGGDRFRLPARTRS